MNEENNIKRKVVTILFLFSVLSLISFIISINAKPDINEKGESYIERNYYGYGRQQVDLEAVIGDDKEHISFPVEELQYSEKEMDKVFTEAGEIIEKSVLGDNESLDKIDKNLNFITTVPGMPIKIVWLLDDNDIVDYTGNVNLDNAKVGSNIITLTAEMTYKNISAEHSFSVNIVKPQPTDKEKLKVSLEDKVKKKEENTREEKVIVLPTSVNGKNVLWKYPKDSRAMGILLLGIIIAFGIYIDNEQKIKKEEETKKLFMSLDYANIVSQMTLFINAGMTIGNAWRKIVAIYVMKKDKIGVRPAYEEMLYTVHEMDQGVSEKDCYLNFGRRCNLSVYRKFGTMLSSNLRKGNKNLLELLKKEALNAFEERKNLAKKKGEEASTKLLGPMFVMFSILLAIIVVPAFLSIRL